MKNVAIHRTNTTPITIKSSLYSDIVFYFIYFVQRGSTLRSEVMKSDFTSDMPMVLKFGISLVEGGILVTIYCFR